MIVGMKNKDKITDGEKQRFVEIIETKLYDPKLK